MKIKYIYYYLHHLFTAKNTRGHGIHSPFIFQYVQNVIYEKHPYYIFKNIEQQRKKLLSDNSVINVIDFGAGVNRERKISDIAQKSLKRKKYAQLLYRTSVYFKSNNILELGTSLGITTAYIAASSESAKVFTLEGCPQTAKVARKIFGNLELKNIDIIEGNIDQTLEETLKKTSFLDLIFIDANHRYEPLIDYFVKCLTKVHSNTVIFIDDIYWSDGMKKAWEKIKTNEKVTSTIDVFEMGIVFFNPVLNKMHYKLII
jgi:predicted O-methyltransferase YrrM